jgi:hypothetical protein
MAGCWSRNLSAKGEVMNLQTRVRKLEDAHGDRGKWNLTLLTDAELIELESCFTKAESAGAPVGQFITPELERALERVTR